MIGFFYRIASYVITLLAISTLLVGFSDGAGVPKGLDTNTATAVHRTQFTTGAGRIHVSRG